MRHWVITPYDPLDTALFDKVWDYDLAHNTIAVGWSELGDVHSLTREELLERVVATYGDTNSNASTSQLWNFLHEIQVDDIVVARRGTKKLLAIGKVTKTAYYDETKARDRVGTNALKPYPNFLDLDWDPKDISFPQRTFAQGRTVHGIDQERFDALVAGAVPSPPPAESQDRPRVVAMVWKKLGDTDAGALLDLTPPSGSGKGAKHIPMRQTLPMARILGDPAVVGGDSEEPEYEVELRGSDGSSTKVRIVFDIRGANDGRKEWRIQRQHTNVERPSDWEPGKKLPAAKDAVSGHYIFILRLSDGSLHARLATRDEVDRMPSGVRNRVLNEDQGWLELR